jgi:hypothetical protein
MQWIAVNGWDDLRERLFELGDTDYSEYERIERHMVRLSSPSLSLSLFLPVSACIFSWDRHVLIELVGLLYHDYLLRPV